MTSIRKRKEPGHGSLRGQASGRRIVCIFPDDTFEEIRAIAIEEGTSFAEQVRTLVEWGLEERKDAAA